VRPHCLLAPQDEAAQAGTFDKNELAEVLYRARELGGHLRRHSNQSLPQRIHFHRGAASSKWSRTQDFGFGVRVLFKQDATLDRQVSVEPESVDGLT